MQSSLTLQGCVGQKLGGVVVGVVVVVVVVGGVGGGDGVGGDGQLQPSGY